MLDSFIIMSYIMPLCLIVIMSYLIPYTIIWLRFIDVNKLWITKKCKSCIVTYELLFLCCNS